MEAGTEKPHRSWLRRHWKLVLAVSIAVGLSGASAVILKIGNSEAAKLAIAEASASPALAERLGRPLKTGWFVSGTIEISPESGHAELAIPISGPKGSGTIYTEARKRAGLWHLEMLQFGNDGSTERIDLMPADTAKPTAPPQS